MIPLLIAILLLIVLLQVWMEKVVNIMATKLNDLTALVVSLTTQVNKSKDEVLKKIGDLEAALANTEIPAAAEEAIASLKAAVQAVDDVVPDEVK